MRGMNPGRIQYFDGLQDYQATWQAMRDFTDQRDSGTPDELWLLEHEAVFTQGQAGKPEHVLNAHDIPIVQSDRGGQVTYHGPGQLVVYCLIDLKRLGIGVKSLVCRTEKALLALLNSYDVDAHLQQGAPGVYVANQKIASLGFRVRRGCSYHGLSLNVNMDLTPFSYINPCGFSNMKMIQLHDLLPTIAMPELKKRLAGYLQLSFSEK